MLFTSGDNLHRRTVPLFLSQDQSFAEAAAFKAALRELDDYYDQFPDQVKELGVMVFAHYPPAELDNLVIELWDKHMHPDWRYGAESSAEVLARWRAAQQQGSAAEFRARIEGAEPMADAEAQFEDEPTTSSSATRCPFAKASGACSPRRSRTRKRKTAQRSATTYTTRAPCFLYPR